jgi:hypothetical protein
MPVTTSFEPDYETYLRQIGRCGRFGKLGLFLKSFLQYLNVVFFLYIGYAFNLIGSERDFNAMKASN